MKVDELHVMSHASSKVTKDYHIELKQRGVTSLALVPYESDEKRCQQADVPAPWRFQGREGSGWFPLTKMYSINGYNCDILSKQLMSMVIRVIICCLNKFCSIKACGYCLWLIVNFDAPPGNL